MNKFAKSAVLAMALMTTVGATAASALTYDAFASFNGVNGNNGFTFGYTDSTTLTAFDFSGTGGQCILGGPVCLYSTANGQLPQASIGGSAGTVSVPSDAILVHPGNSATLSDFASFTSSTAGAFTYKIALKSVGIDTTNGVGYTPFTVLGGVVTLGTRGVLPTYGSAVTLTGTQTLLPTQAFGVIVDDNGVYYGDSTGLNFTVSDVAAVPEPATWGLLIAGFAMVGYGLRRRTSPATV